MSNKLLFGLADTLGFQLELVEPDLILGSRNKSLSVIGHKHTHRVVIVSSCYFPKKFVAVGVRVIGHLGLVVIVEDFDNVPVTTIAVDMTKVDLQSIFKGGKVNSVSDLKKLVEPRAKAVMTRDAQPVANNTVRKWACSD